MRYRTSVVCVLLFMCMCVLTCRNWPSVPSGAIVMRTNDMANPFEFCSVIMLVSSARTGRVYLFPSSARRWYNVPNHPYCTDRFETVVWKPGQTFAHTNTQTHESTHTKIRVSCLLGVFFCFNSGIAMSTSRWFCLVSGASGSVVCDDLFSVGQPQSILLTILFRDTIFIGNWRVDDAVR